MKKESYNWLKYIIIFLVIEKIIQHGLTSVFFIYNIKGIGSPDIGTRFLLSNNTMAISKCFKYSSFINPYYSDKMEIECF